MTAEHPGRQWDALAAFWWYRPIACELEWTVWRLETHEPFFHFKTEGRVTCVRAPPGQEVKHPITGETIVFKLQRRGYGPVPSPVLWPKALFKRNLTLLPWK